MKTLHSISLMILLCLILNCFSINAQNILVNGGVNTGGSGCDYNKTDTEFNSLSSGLLSFAVGNDGEIDIMKSSCFGSPPVEGNAKLGLAHNAPLSRYDQMSFDLTQSLTAGDVYNISFYMDVRPSVSGEDGKLEFGISVSNGSFGTLAYSSPTYAANSGWIQVTASFTAPVSGNFLVVRPVEDNNGSDRCWIHVDDFVLTGPPPPVPLDCDLVSFDSDTTILPLNISAPNDYTFAVEDWIKMTGAVASGSAGDTLVEVRADQYIELNAPFESKLGTNAFYHIAPCVPVTTLENDKDDADQNLKRLQIDKTATDKKLTKFRADDYSPSLDLGH